jgi:4-hydroxy-tetrahydrodipicolinate reductase
MLLQPGVLSLAWSPARQLSSSSTATGGHVPGLVATAMRVVNAIPGVVAAQPGIRSLLDTPLVTGKGLYASTIR